MPEQGDREQDGIVAAEVAQETTTAAADVPQAAAEAEVVTNQDAQQEAASSGDAEGQDTTAAEADGNTATEAPTEDARPPEESVEPAADTGTDPALAADLARREEICTEAEQVAATADFSRGPADLRRLQDEWNGVRRWHDPREDALWGRFKAAREAFYGARDAAREATRQAKEKLIAEAEGLAQSTQWNQTTERMRQMMDEWKAAGRTGQHEVDDELWGRFNAARQTFAKRRQEHYAQLDAQRAAAKQAKEALIEEARAVAVGTEDWTAQQWREASDKMADLMARWKKAGVAQRADNDRLWEEFRAARQPFFDAQHAHYDRLDEAHRKAAEAKAALVERARALADGGDFGREATEAAKQLDREWKQLGYAGKEANDRLWKEFNTEKERFWAERQTAGDARHAEWRQRLEEAVDRRKTRIQNLKEQVARLQDRINNAYATDHVEEMQERLDDRQETLEQLQQEVADMEARLAADDTRKG